MGFQCGADNVSLEGAAFHHDSQHADKLNPYYYRRPLSTEVTCGSGTTN